MARVHKHLIIGLSDEYFIGNRGCFESVSICNDEVIALSLSLPPPFHLQTQKYLVGKEEEVKVLTAKVNDARKGHKMFSTLTRPVLKRLPLLLYRV